MNLKELIDIQKTFDCNHKGNFEWAQQINSGNIEILEYLLLCLVGEFGETSNLVKKVVRGDYTLEEIKPEISEEVADIFIYILKLAYQLDIDLEEQFLTKVEKNKVRFTKFEKELR